MIRHMLVLAALPLAAAPALAQQRNAAPQAQSQASGPQRLGAFQDWTAATYQEGNNKICYAFTRMEGRQNALLTVTHRPQGRDQVALRIGRSFPRNAEVKVDVGNNDLDFYTSGDNAFARNGRAAVAAFRSGREATAKSPAPNNRSTTETFSLSGFTAAYEAISKECPPGATRR
ncbi:MAG TPA: invasion associated locus B family protein [Roseomonas sp.]|jgi:invasion protein IalB